MSNFSACVLENAIHLHVAQLSPLQVSPQKVSYFTGKLVCGGADQVETQVISFNEKLLTPMQQAIDQQKPVEVINYRERQNKYDTTKTDFVLGDLTEVKPSQQQIAFHPKYNFINTTFTEIKEIKNIALGEDVNLKVYVTRGTHTENVETPSGTRQKLACYVNDINQDGINFDVWSNFIKMIPESATYNIYSAKVKSFNGRYIATSANTVIVRSKEDLPKSEKPSECLEVCFPAESVDLYDANYTCVRCNRQACESDKLIVCPHCHSKSLLVKSTKKVFIKFTFKNNLKLTMYHDQYLEFCALLSISPNDQAEAEMVMLTAEKIKLKYTPTNHVVLSVIPNN